MMMVFTGCQSNLELQAELITSSIDADIKGIVTDEYLENSGWTREQALEERDNFARAMVENLQYTYGFSEVPEPSVTEQMMPFYRGLLLEFEYTVTNAVENEDGSVTATITYKPFALGKVLDEIAYPFYDQITSSEANDPAKLDEELFGLFESAIVDFMENPQFAEEISMEITVYTYDDEELDYGWELSDNYYGDFAYSIIDLNLE